LTRPLLVEFPGRPRGGWFCSHSAFVFGIELLCRTLDWTERETNDSLFGPVIGKSRRIKNLSEEIENEFMKKSWTNDTVEHGPVHSWVKSDTAKSGTSWLAEQVWGVEEIDGERRYARHVHFIGPGGEVIDARLVYDYGKVSYTSN